MNNQSEIKETAESAVKSKSGRGSSGFIILFAIILIIAIVVTALVTFSYTIKEFCHVTDENSLKLQTITKLIEENAYYDPQNEEMLGAALKAYVGAAGDKYTVYYDAEEYAALTQENQGHYVGIGVTTQEASVEYLGRSVAVLEVVRVAADSPAETAGLLAGDYIYAVDTDEGVQYVEDVGRDIAVELIRGERGTTVKLLWLTWDGIDYILKEAELTRKEVVTVSAEFRVSETDPSVGVVSLYQFDLTTPTQLCSAFDSLKSQGITNVVLDLRDNGGGDLLSVIACASYFVGHGDVIITAESKDGTKDTQRAVRRVYSNSYSSCTVLDEDIGKYRDFRVAVLVNENTASAAELLTAVFRDYKLAPVIGVQTFGKGSVQRLISLEPYGIEGGIKVTTSLYYPPNGEGYNGVGITPDIIVELAEGLDINNISEQQDTQLVRAIEELTK